MRGRSSISQPHINDDHDRHKQQNPRRHSRRKEHGQRKSMFLSKSSELFYLFHLIFIARQVRQNLSSILSEE